MPKLPREDYPPPQAEPPASAAPNTPRPDTSHPDTPRTIPADVTPLAIILEAMRDRYRARDYDAAVALARIAAPYLHPRVPPKTPPADLAALPDVDLDSLPTHD